MKRLSKLLSLALAPVMALTMSVTAFAATITVENTVEGEKYTAYKIFDVSTSGSGDNKTYAYTINAKIGRGSEENDNPWVDIVKNYTVQKSDAIEKEGEQPLSVFDLTLSTEDTNKYVVTINTYTNTENEEISLFKEDKDAASFAAYLEENLPDTGLTEKVDYYDVTAGKKDNGSVSAAFDDLAPGYYFVTTSLGSLCALHTSVDSMIISEKNSVPTLEKKILVTEMAEGGEKETEGGEKETEKDETTASIGDTIKYQITVTDGTGTDNAITVHDVMENGLTLVTDEDIPAQKDFRVKTVSGSDEDETDAAIGERDWEVSTGKETGGGVTVCTFEITFKSEFIKKLAVDDKIIITYYARLNKDAQIAADTNDNTAWLTYSEHTSQKDTVKVSTYSFDLIKTGEATAEGDSTYNVLAGAEFELYDALKNGDKIPLMKVSDGTYRVADSTERAASGFESATIEVGEAVIKGLGNGDYYLEETKSPSGYSGLTNREKVTIKDANLVNTKAVSGVGVATYTRAVSDDNKDTGIQVINKTGTILPSTGGIGTTIFYILGAILVIGSGVLLVVKKRMRDAE